MQLESCRTVPHSKLEMTQPRALDFLSWAVAGEGVFPLLGKKEAETATGPCAWSWSLGGAGSCSLCGVVRFFGVLFLCFGWQGWGGW